MIRRYKPSSTLLLHVAVVLFGAFLAAADVQPVQEAPNAAVAKPARPAGRP